MYNERERLLHHRQLLDGSQAAADLQLLEQKAPRYPSLDEFRLAPQRHHEAILFALLGVASRGDIEEHRLRVKSGRAGQAVPAVPTSGEEAPAAPTAKKKTAKARKTSIRR